MSDHESKFVLTKVSEGPGFVAYRMGIPGTRMESTDFTFTSAPLDERIIITGDFQPGEHTRGVVSCLGYGVEWFARQSPSNYLCEKFLRTDFHQTHARRVLQNEVEEAERELAENEPDDKYKAKIEARIEALEEAIDAEGHGDDPTRSSEAFYDLLEDHYDDSEVYGGAIGYDPDEARRLGKIQQRFARLYAATGET